MSTPRIQRNITTRSTHYVDQLLWYNSTIHIQYLLSQQSTQCYPRLGDLNTFYQHGAECTNDYSRDTCMWKESLQAGSRSSATSIISRKLLGIFFLKIIKKDSKFIL